MASRTVGDAVLGQQQPRRWRTERTESIAGRVLAASSTNYGRQRTLSRLQSTIERPEFWLVRVFSWLAALFVQAYGRFVQELNSLSLPLKAGLAASICSVLCFAPGPLSVFNQNGTWAVVTVDMVLETTVGLTFSQGINQTLGTLTAAAMALLVMFLAPMCGEYEAYFVVLCVFLGAALATMCKFRIGNRWNLAVSMSLIIFHILILSKGEFKDKRMVPAMLLVTIAIGFLVASLINLSIRPKFAGSAINELIAKNFERAGNAIDRCVVAYCEGKVLEQMPDLLAGSSDDENVHMSYHEIIGGDSEVEKLLKAVPFEPCHGKFFFGYPWDLYEHIMENLKHTFYDVVELDSCLHSEIQAPLHLRRVFEDEFLCIGEECAQVFRDLGESIRTMRPLHSRSPLETAEEGALLLEHKIAKYTGSLLGDAGAAENEIARKDPEERKALDVIEEHVALAFQEANDDPTFATPEADFGSPQPSPELSDSHRSADSIKSTTHLARSHRDFIQRRESMSRQWDTTVQRISALSLIKFAALLIEVVAKTRYVVSIIEELEIKARFDEHERTLRFAPCDSTVSEDIIQST